MVAQVIGAVLASAVILMIANGAPGGYSAPLSGLGADGYGAHSPGNYSMMAGFVTETVLTMFLVLTVLGSTDIAAPVGFAGIGIGLVLTLIHLVGIPITNTSVNPARSIGPAIFVGGWALQQLWLFIVAPFVGAVVAALIYAAMRHPAALITTRKAEQALPGEQIDRIA
jgi:aquaporin Z